MKTHGWSIAILLLAGSALGASGPAATTGACSHVFGPLGGNGLPIGFTCTDVAGSAVLVWNASQMTGPLRVDGGIRTLNLFTSDFTVNQSYTSDGPTAFIGNASISISGSITASTVVIASLSANASQVSGALLGTGSITSGTTSPVLIDRGGKVTATSGNLSIGGSYIINSGSLTASNGTVSLVTGTRLNVGWDNVAWDDGYHSFSEDHQIDNGGTIKGSKVHLEARRANSALTSIFNSKKISATGSVTLVTGVPGQVDGFGNSTPGTFGVSNVTGDIYATDIVISPYAAAPPGARTFSMTNPAELAQLQRDLGGQFYDPTQDNTPAGSTSVISDTTSRAQAGVTTPALVIPQLAVSVSHMNASSITRTPIAVARNNTTSTEVVRGAGNAGTNASTRKPRVKAKPVLVRGTFFDSKLSAKLSAASR